MFWNCWYGLESFKSWLVYRENGHFKYECTFGHFKYECTINLWRDFYSHIFLENSYFPFMQNYYIIQEYRLIETYKFSNMWLVSGNDYTDWGPVNWKYNVFVLCKRKLLGSINFNWVSEKKEGL